MNKETTKKQSLLRNSGVQTILGSVLCIILGLLIGYVVLLIINPSGAGKAITAILKNYLYYPRCCSYEIFGNDARKGLSASDVFPVSAFCVEGWSF